MRSYIGIEEGSRPPWEGMWYVFVGLKVERTRPGVAGEEDEAEEDEDGMHDGVVFEFVRVGWEGREEGAVSMDDDRVEAMEDIEGRKRFMMMLVLVMGVVGKKLTGPGNIGWVLIPLNRRTIGYQ